jgi:hypothetical protein
MIVDKLDDEPEAEEPKAEESDGDGAKLKAARLVRHAITDGDDEALAEALSQFIDIDESEEGEDEPEPKSKPNLAAILLATKKRK